MIGWRCSHESDTAHAANVGEWPEGLRVHAADCPVCRDVALVAGALGRERRRLPADPPGLCAGRVWWIAQLRARRTAAERALRPISVMELIAMAATVPVAFRVLASVLPMVASWLTELRAVPAVAEFGGHAALPAITVAVSAGLVLLLVALARVGLTGTDR